MSIFHGLITAIITPFKNDLIDLVSLKKVLQYQIMSGVKTIVVAGSTGEGSNLDIDEYRMLIESAVEIAGTQLNVIAGCASSSTTYAIKLAQTAQVAGVSGLMCTMPPYVKPTMSGICSHIQFIHDNTDLQIMLYNNPARTAVDISDQAIIQLSQLPRVAAIKDSSNDLTRPLRLKSAVKANFNMLTGDDPISLAYSAQGGMGCVSVVANIMPELCKKLQDHILDNDFAAAYVIHQKLLPYYQALFLETNPIAVKYAAKCLGLCEAELRLPLMSASTDTMDKIDRILKKM